MTLYQKKDNKFIQLEQDSGLKTRKKSFSLESSSFFGKDNDLEVEPTQVLNQVESKS